MQPVTDWTSLWRELAEVQRQRHALGSDRAADHWGGRARRFDEEVKRRWATPDSSRQLVLSQLEPGATVLDIGAGTGAWAILMAPHVRRVTAVEPSPAMAEILRANLAAANIPNVEVIQARWPEAKVEPHDFTLCSHAMYAVADLPQFVRATMACTRRTCFFLLRAPEPDSLLAEAARHIWGQPHDSPNFAVGYNILLEMGIHANVLMETGAPWRPFVFADLDEALADLKHRFALDGTIQHDDYLRALLTRRGIQREGQFGWANQTRSALVYWNVESPLIP